MTGYREVPPHRGEVAVVATSNGREVGNKARTY